MKRAVLMCRVSTDEQANGYSLDIQEEKLVRYCLHQDILVDKVFREDHSAKDFNRPEFQRLLHYLKERKGQIDLLLVTSWDRFSRNARESYNMIDLLQNLGVNVQSVDSPIDFSDPTQKLMFAIHASMPEIDNDIRSRKVREGMYAAAKAGRWARKAPIGYKNTRDEKNKPIIVPSEDAKHIQYMFEQVALDIPQTTIIKRLNKKGFSITPSMMSRILRSPVYIGKVICKGEFGDSMEIHDGLHQPLITERQFYKVQRILEQRASRKGILKKKTQKEELQLRGVLMCPSCENPLTGSASRGGSGKKHHYYHCNYCKPVRFRADNAHEVLQEMFGEWTFNKEVQEIYDQVLAEVKGIKGVDTDLDRNKLIQEITTAQAKIQKARDAFLEDVIDAREFHAMKDMMQEKINDARRALEDLKGTYTGLKSKLKREITHLSNLQKVYTKAPVDEKVELLRSIFPSGIKFEGKNYRTDEVNPIVALSILKDNDFQKQKTRQLSPRLQLSRLVAPPGIEPGSKV